MSDSPDGQFTIGWYCKKTRGVMDEKNFLLLRKNQPVAEGSVTRRIFDAKVSDAGRFALQLESPHATIMFGLRRETLLGKAEEPDAVVAAVDAVTADDVRRVAQDVLGDSRLLLALVGPFDDASRFEPLIAA